MMKNLYNNLWRILVAGFLLVACTEDKGNYDYRNLTELEISGVDDNISVLTHNRLQLTPDFGTSALPDDRYEFEWKVINQDIENEVETVIGNTRNLDYEVTLNADVYTLYFTVTEKDTGIYWQKNYTLTVSDTTSEGWMVLCSDEEGRARLDMVSKVTGDTYFDLLKNYSEISQWKGPRKIQSLSSTMTDAQSPFYLLTDDGATRLGKNNFEWKEEYNFAYEAAVNGASLRPYSITAAGLGKMIVSGKEAYYCERGMGIDGLYQSVVNKTFDVAPYVGANVAASMYVAVYLLYDTTNKCFMAYCPMMAYEDLGSLEPLVTMDKMEEIATSFKGDNGVVHSVSYDYPEGYDYVYMENTKYDPGNAKMGTTYTILTKDGRSYLYGIQLGDLLLYADCTYVLGKSYYGDLSGCTGIGEEGTLYAFSSLKNYMYYAVDNTVYRVDLSVSPLEAERQFALNGETITCLKFNLYRESANASRSYDLVVGSVDGAGKGILRVYEGLESEGDFSSVTPEKYTGFARACHRCGRRSFQRDHGLLRAGQPAGLRGSSLLRHPRFRRRMLRPGTGEDSRGPGGDGNAPARNNGNPLRPYTGRSLQHGERRRNLLPARGAFRHDDRKTGDRSPEYGSPENTHRPACSRNPRRRGGMDGTRRIHPGARRRARGRRVRRALEIQHMEQKSAGRPGGSRTRSGSGTARPAVRPVRTDRHGPSLKPRGLPGHNNRPARRRKTAEPPRGISAEAGRKRSAQTGARRTHPAGNPRRKRMGTRRNPLRFQRCR